MEEEDEVEIRISVPVVLDDTHCAMNKQQKDLAPNAKFAVTDVDKWRIFTRIALGFAKSEAHRKISKLVRFSKTLVHWE